MRTFSKSILTFALCSFIVSSLFAQSDSIGNCEEQFQNWKQQQVSDFIGGPYDFPKVVTQEAPVYPDSAKQHGVEGTVIVWFLVDTNGNPQCPRILEAAGYGFDEAALSAIRKWRFKPISLHGGTPYVEKERTLLLGGTIGHKFKPSIGGLTLRYSFTPMFNSSNGMFFPMFGLSLGLAYN